jgi:hypothetical protein
MMRCDEFERTLRELFADDPSPARRDEFSRALLEHARCCEACRDAADLVELLVEAPGGRDEAAGPPPGYAEELLANVRRRTRGLAAGRRVAWRALAAAAVVVAAVGAWVALRSSPGAVPSDPGPHAGELAPGGDAVPDQLDTLLRDAAMGEAADGLDFLAGLDGLDEPALDTAGPVGGDVEPAIGPGDVFPDVDRMDEQSREALLRWLRQSASGGRGVES